MLQIFISSLKCERTVADYKMDDKNELYDGFLFFNIRRQTFNTILKVVRFDYVGWNQRIILDPRG